jgi:cytochrome c oxidase assembly protein subunit 11
MTDKKSHRKIYMIGGIVAALMFGFCFAMVPLYGLVCKWTGVNTSVPTAELVTPVKATAAAVDKTRDVTIQFVATNHMGLPWDFYPRTKSIRVHPGENTKVFFYAKNATEKLMSVQAIPSMTPPESISHFHKIECFCFRQQTLKGGESKEMPLIFQIDKDLPKDVHVITLAYTLFDTTTNVKPPKEIKKG